MCGSGSRSRRAWRASAREVRAAMRILVLLEVGADVRIPPELDPRSGRVREEWLVRELDPAERARSGRWRSR